MTTRRDEKQILIETKTWSSKWSVQDEEDDDRLSPSVHNNNKSVFFTASVFPNHRVCLGARQRLIRN